MTSCKHTYHPFCLGEMLRNENKCMVCGEVLHLKWWTTFKFVNEMKSCKHFPLQCAWMNGRRNWKMHWPSKLDYFWVPWPHKCDQVMNYANCIYFFDVGLWSSVISFQDFGSATILFKLTHILHVWVDDHAFVWWCCIMCLKVHHAWYFGDFILLIGYCFTRNVVILHF
jgi:hypothetical protein